MLQLNVIEGSNKALIQYPKEARLPKKTINVWSPAHAEQKWEIETRAYVYSMLRKWTIYRNNAMKVSHTLSGARAANVDKILRTLINHQSSSLRLLANKIVEHYDLFVSILPSENSKNYLYTKKVIVPILLWCKEYKDLINKKNSNT